jgi:hypothetical protein
MVKIRLDFFYGSFGDDPSPVDSKELGGIQRIEQFVQGLVDNKVLADRGRNPRMFLKNFEKWEAIEKPSSRRISGLAVRWFTQIANAFRF